MRRRLLWLVIIPFVVAGSELGHAAANALLGAPEGSRGELFQGSGPGADLALPFAAALLAVVVVALAAAVVVGWGADPARRAQRSFALLPPLLFVVQESSERLLDTGRLSPTILLERHMLAGLVLQVPFAAVAYLLARLLLELADRVHRRINGAVARRRRGPPVAWPAPRRLRHSPRTPGTRRGRAPPALVSTA